MQGQKRAREPESDEEMETDECGENYPKYFKCAEEEQKREQEEDENEEQEVKRVQSVWSVCFVLWQIWNTTKICWIFINILWESDGLVSEIENTELDIVDNKVDILQQIEIDHLFWKVSIVNNNLNFKQI